MPSTAEVISMIALILIPCVVTAGLLLWERQRRKKTDPQIESFKQIFRDMACGVETRIQEMSEPEEVA